MLKFAPFDYTENINVMKQPHRSRKSNFIKCLGIIIITSIGDRLKSRILNLK